MNNYFVYQHINKLNNKRYIGITCKRPEERWGVNSCKYKSTPHFWNAICKYGWDNFEHEVVASGLSKEEACEMERQLIKQYDTQNREKGYNIFEGGDAPSIPDETRKKMSESMKGNQNGLGKPCSEEKKKKISDAQKGRTLTEEHKKKLSEAKKGKPHAPPSEETRRKISNSHKKTPVKCVETEETYVSIQECARILDINASWICAICKGRRKSAKGLHFVYA